MLSGKQQEVKIVPIYTAPSDTRRKLQVAKWIFTEAQLGRDQLDCHFAWITNCFTAYLQGEGNNLMHPRDMFTALTHPSYDIVNTHVLYGSTAHPLLQKKISMKYVKVHQVHEYSYTALARGEQKVEVAYHGEIHTPHHRTTETFSTLDANYVQWIPDSYFEALPWNMVCIHGCRQKIITINKAKVEDATIMSGKKDPVKVSEFQKDIVRYAHAWASIDYEADGATVATYFKQPEEHEAQKNKNRYERLGKEEAASSSEDSTRDKGKPDRALQHKTSYIAGASTCKIKGNASAREQYIRSVCNE
jgi:hypothetical protein